MAEQARPRLVIIGLDGADWRLLRPLLDAGLMPNLQSAVRSGVRARLESVYPTNSMSAWTSLLTGVNPGKHGVFDFVRRTERPFKTLVTNSSAIRAPTFVEVLSDHEKRSCVIDMPPLYPPFAINGVMIGGIGAVDLQRGGYAVPAGVVERLDAAVGGFHPDVPWVGKAGREDELLGELIALAENRGRVSEFLLQDEPWDLFCTVFVAPDRAQHVFWRDLVERGPRYEQAAAFYRALDSALGRILDRIDLTQTDVLIVSDHGFRTFSKTFSINQYLLEAGLLLPELLPQPNSRRLRARVKRAVGRLLPGRRRSIAFSDVSEGVSINLAGREATGEVPPAEFEETRAQLAERLLSYRDEETGEAVVRRVIKREDYFSGPYAAEAPDLVLEFHEGFAHNNATGTVMFRWQYCQGVHSLDGIIVGLGPSFRSDADAPDVHITDVAPTALSLLGVPYPEETDGRVAGQLLAGAVEAQATGSAQARSREPGAYSEEEEARVRERLRGLGYID